MRFLFHFKFVGRDGTGIPFDGGIKSPIILSQNHHRIKKKTNRLSVYNDLKDTDG